MHSSSKPGFEALVFKAARGIEDIYELIYRRKDGSCVPAVVSVTALRDADDRIIGYLLIGTDNTTRKAIEAQQKILEQRLHDHQFYTRSLFEANIDALITTDPSGVITDVNKQMEILTRCTRDELIGSPFKNYFTDLEAAETAIKLALTHKNLTNYELTARAIDGKETIVSYNATTFYDRNRQLQGVFAAARDITERKKLDQVLLDKNVELEVATLMAEKANLAKSDFLSSMSHELRDPLTAILGFAQLMESNIPPPLPEQNERIAEILRAGWHLLALINDILDLTKIESKDVSISEETVLLSEVMAECQSMMALQAQQHNITLTFPVFSTDCFIRADRTRLKQVITNLISNAIKYNRPEGSVIASCTVDSETEFTRISITDTGIGLSPENIAQLFQRFNRLGQEFSGVSGTGIGLVVVKKLVELMHGVMGVESTVDVGSVFWVELPSMAAPYLSVESDITALAIPPSRHKVGRHTMLYIDDNPVNLKLIEQILASHTDISLLCEVNSTAGIEKARLSQPDVILMDINMPVINGFEALKILRAEVTTAHIPIMAFSANAMPSDIKKGLEAGFCRYITKPIKVSEFIAALDETLNIIHS
jgi:PAS domain S-box-containing protein